MNDRFKFISDFSQPQYFPERLKEFHTRKPAIVCVDTMSDIGSWKNEWRDATYDAMSDNPHNIYLALTRRYDKLRQLQAEVSSDNLTNVRFFIGATVTTSAQAQAVVDIGGADFISFEPLLERIVPEVLADLDCMWWIIGDLTKNGKPQGVAKKEWIDEMLEYAKVFRVPVFVKDSLTTVVGREIKRFPKGWYTYLRWCEHLHESEILHLRQGRRSEA